MKRNSRSGRLRVFSVTPIGLVFAAGCGPPTVRCDGVCPPPSPGVVFDSEIVEKIIWLSDDRIVRSAYPSMVSDSLCSEHLTASGEPSIFYAAESTVIVHTRDGAPAQTLIFDSPLVSRIDMDSDGNSEYVLQHDGSFQMYNAQGELVIEQPRVGSSWNIRDFDGDGRSEWIAWGERELVILDLEGTQQAAIEIERGRIANLYVGRDPDDGQLLLITHTLELGENLGQITDDLVWEADGTRRTDLSANEVLDAESVSGDGFPAADSLLCFRGDWYVDPVETPLGAELNAKITFSDWRIESDRIGGTLGTSVYRSQPRTIVQIEDSSGVLVYKEVLPTLSPVLVLPTESGARIFLVEDGAILTYQSRR